MKNKKFNVNNKGKRSSIYFNEYELDLFKTIWKVEEDKEILKIINNLLEEKTDDYKINDYIKNYMLLKANQKIQKLNLLETPSLFENKEN